jgi:hypothetical protein
LTLRVTIPREASDQRLSSARYSLGIRRKVGQMAAATSQPGRGESVDPEAERTPDGRYIVVGGRRWRASDPGIPEALRAELVSELMAARRAVRDADEEGMATARARVQDAKVALGERGDPWWEPPSEPGERQRLAAVMRTLLRKRPATSTICPSDAARVVGGEHWRGEMSLSRDVAFALAEEGVLEVRQQGRKVDGRTARGALRLARGPGFDR